MYILYSRNVQNIWTIHTMTHINTVQIAKYDKKHIWYRTFKLDVGIEANFKMLKIKKKTKYTISQQVQACAQTSSKLAYFYNFKKHR